MNFGAIALLVDGIMTAAVGLVLLHKLQSTGEVVNKEIEAGVKQLVEQAPDILVKALQKGQEDGSSQA